MKKIIVIILTILNLHTIEAYLIDAYTRSPDNSINVNTVIITNRKSTPATIIGRQKGSLCFWKEANKKWDCQPNTNTIPTGASVILRNSNGDIFNTKSTQNPGWDKTVTLKIDKNDSIRISGLTSSQSEVILTDQGVSFSKIAVMDEMLRNRPL